MWAIYCWCKFEKEHVLSDEVLRLVQIANEYLYFVGCVIVPVSVSYQIVGYLLLKVVQIDNECFLFS